ncbi:hypothetical protein Tco_0607718 [Tanacetum coccineum]
MKRTRNKPKLEVDRYVLFDRVMHPLAPHYERKTRSDHGTKRRCESNPSSSSSTLNHPSSSHHLDENVDGSDEESTHANSSYSSQTIGSLSNILLRVLSNPPHERQPLDLH